MQKKIKYVGFYDVLESKSDRVSNLAAINKMNYISDALVDAGYNVEFISPSWMGDNTNIKFEKQKSIIINKNKNIIFAPSWKTNSKIMYYIKISFSLFWLFYYLMIHVKKDEKIIAYHVQWISLPIRAAKFFKKFKLILEIEEIYGEVWENTKLMNSWEKKLINCADKYLLVSDLLSKRFESNKKNSLVIYGSYETNNIGTLEKNKQNKIILVYAGSVDEKKGGAFKAIEVMNYLPDNYFLYILGHGNKDSIKKLKEKINKMNSSRNKKVCVYKGVKHGKEYSDFLLKCDIALNPQNQGQYMQSAFPSKIISYLVHNLKVVTTDIESVRTSEVADLLYFTKDDNPNNIANSIKKVDFTEEYNSKQFIQDLHNKFVVDIKELIEKNMT